MRKFVCMLLFISIVLIASIYPRIAFAKTITVEVLPNRTELIYRFVQLNEENCSSMAIPKMKVISVGHGKIRSKNGGFWIDSGPCKGLKMKGIDIYYTPNPGFRGEDNAKVNLSMAYYVDDSGHSTRTLTFRIRVANNAKRVKKTMFRPKSRTVNDKNQVCFDCSNGSYSNVASGKVTCVPKNDASMPFLRKQCKKLDKRITIRPKRIAVKKKKQICFFCQTRLSITSKEGKVCISPYDMVDLANLRNYCTKL